jgi:hypothetical protein
LGGFLHFHKTYLTVTLRITTKMPPPPPSLDVGNGWIAIREITNPSPGWYFYNKAEKKTQRNAPSIQFLHHILDSEDFFGLAVFLDEEFRKKKPELNNQLTPLLSAADFFARRKGGGGGGGGGTESDVNRKTTTEIKKGSSIVLKINSEKKDIIDDPRIDAFRSQFGALLSFETTQTIQNEDGLTPLSAVAEPLFGPSSWADENMDIDSTVDKTLQTVSNIILSSAPHFEDESQTLKEWSLLCSFLSKPDAIYDIDTLQRLASCTDAICLDFSARCAISHLLATGNRFSESQTALIQSAFEEIEDSNALAIIRSVSIFANCYTPQAGQILIRSGELKSCLNILRKVIVNPQWRRTLLELSEKSAVSNTPDPFLDIAVSIISEGLYRKEVAGAAALATNTNFAETLSSDVLVEISSIQQQSSTLLSRSSILMPVLTSEISSLLTSLALNRFSERFVNSFEDEEHKNQIDDDFINANDSLDTTMHTTRLKSINEELGYGILRREGALSSSLSVLPADADVMLEAAAYAPELNVGFSESRVNGAEGEESTSIFDACLQLRKISLNFFIDKGARDEFFPTSFVKCGGIDLEISPFSSSSGSITKPVLSNDTVPLSSFLNDTDLTTQNEDISMGIDAAISEEGKNEEHQLNNETLRKLLNIAETLDIKSLTDVLNSLNVLKVAQFDVQMVKELKTKKAEADVIKETAMQRLTTCSTNSENLIQEAALNAKLSHAIDSLLLAFALTARTLRQTDVLILLTHLLLSPTISLGQGANRSSAAETVASALSWALNLASDPSLWNDEIRTDIGRPCLQTHALFSPTDTLQAESMLSDLEAKSNVLLAKYEVFGKTILEVNASTNISSGIITKLRNVSSSFPPPDELEFVEDFEASICISGLSHPCIAIGLIHWMKHISFDMLSRGKPQTCARSFPIFARIVVAFSSRWPLLTNTILDLFRVFLHLQAKISGEAANVILIHNVISDSIVDLFISTGFQVPILQFCLYYCYNGGEIEDLRNILSKICKHLTDLNSTSTFMSLDFAIAFSKLVLALQKRIYLTWDSGNKRSDVLSITDNTQTLRKILTNASILLLHRNDSKDLEDLLREIEKGVV